MTALENPELEAALALWRDLMAEIDGLSSSVEYDGALAMGMADPDRDDASDYSVRVEVEFLRLEDVEAITAKCRSHGARLSFDAGELVLVIS
jgi:hypothetical protein